MDNLTWINNLSEAKVLAKLAEQKLHVFTQTTGKAPFDMILVSKKNLFRISVKGTWIKKQKTTNSYTIQLRRIRSNKKKNIIYNFDNSECDILAIYIKDLDKVCFIPSLLIKTKGQIALREEKSRFSTSNWIISEWEDISKTLKYLED